jgi:hypothetical protein
MNQLNLSPLQQQRYDQALDDFWKEPVHATNRNIAQVQDESVWIATAAAKASTMSDVEFKTITSELVSRGLESGDVGGEFYSRVISNLRELRRLPS